MQLDNLIVEVTRKCNMMCEHCLRGEPQNKTMKDEYMYNLLRQVSYISSVTFSGGEPTLPSGMKVIERFMEICNELGVSVGSFYIVTNAKSWRTKLPALINRLYNFCDDNEVSHIDISNDRYHCGDANNFKWRLEEELLYNHGLEELVGLREDIDPSHVIGEGRGVRFGTAPKDRETILYDEWDDELQIREGSIYLNCNGNVVAGCDWSYETQDEPEYILCKCDDDMEQSILDYDLTEKE